ncbi:TIGR00300 family protein [Candidatus Nitrosotenuis cloacae]|jgi:lysine-ketoglutarate reductase/saccharopine dehydrogenase-like protein (TIGR00300 family)|uniref:ornithine cyclodeaminase n=1 Tax=Candidatus Nitrosotenuis cloacae TaxID=1603555 RepID=UPI00227DB265|nr:TIGR00300 family protein [Candidatus Nitrosotenuis cloacae]
MKFSSDVEVRGHLIDSMILTKIFDVIMDLEGEFEVLTMQVGKKKKDPSYAKLQIQGKNQAHLDKILEQVYRVGATPTVGREVVLKAAAKDMVMPDNFYSTTNNTTHIFLGGKWIEVENMMMDKCIVVKNGRASCVPIREIKKGDKVVVGETGVKITPPERPRDGSNVFEFMGSSSSSERPTQHIAKKVAQDIFKTKKSGGKIIIVGGPAIVHTGAADSVAELIRLGYIDGVLAGNALAVHDIEYATLGTSLGMNVNDGSLAVKGHRNHMEAINAVFRSGSIANMVKTKVLKKGIMYECVKNKVPFVLAGSLRDDGPLPDVITDTTIAQKKYKEILKGAKMVIMVSTMLHSIATGNMIPANVKVVVVDINQPTVTKLMDRGTWQALGIVTDVGAFLPLVTQEIKKLKR